MLSKVPETDAARLDQAYSPNLGKAISALLEIIAYGESNSSAWGKQMENAARKWHALYTYREQPLGDIRKLIEWYQSTQLATPNRKIYELKE